MVLQCSIITHQVKTLCTSRHPSSQSLAQFLKFDLSQKPTRLRRLQRLQICSSTQLHRCNSYDYNNGTLMLHYNSSSEDSLYLSTSLLSIS
ncbi:hypothetical protein IGI04_023317 [Brassica rapa subsp. trilocularis]|uniref:Uncharacterized protein n=1 Tax=Brassica rapa subsp. trilocularis TaxID=1813537 RepID=A0ABQ7M3I7_BRACM|nr:hypothetical protein IGI04_023317 [Brassica rapa subsp. trilocularis]